MKELNLLFPTIPNLSGFILFQMLPFLMPSMTTLNCETEEIQKILYIMQDLGIFLDPDYLGFRVKINNG